MIRALGWTARPSCVRSSPRRAASIAWVTFTCSQAVKYQYGRERSAGTFDSQRLAARETRAAEAAIEVGSWIDPSQGQDDI
jgi:hypothetical protein